MGNLETLFKKKGSICFHKRSKTIVQCHLISVILLPCAINCFRLEVIYVLKL